jgi:PhnB protein
MAMSCITPYLCVHNSADAIAFYEKAFGGVETMRLEDKTGRIQHAEVDIGGAKLMFADEFPDIGFLSPKTLGTRPPVMLSLGVSDVDAVYRQAVDSGATSLRAPADQFYGERTAQLRDPFGHIWALMTRKEDLSSEEVVERFEAIS